MKKQHSLSVIFLTYSAVGDQPGATAFLGVLKRCLRLITGLRTADITCHLLNFGAIPYDDPLVRHVLPHVRLHSLSEGMQSYADLFSAVQPDVVVLGEGPGSGTMLDISRAALAAGIPQVCIENYYGPGQPRHYKKENPWIDRWLLLGLPFGNEYGRITPDAELVPPLLPAGGDTADIDPADITILGYDITVARLGLALLRKLPPSTTARLVYSGAVKKHLYEFRTATTGLNVQFAELPTERLLQQFLQTSRIIVCKSGFQQMVECLAAGTPAIVYDAPGGVPEILLAGPMRPYVQYLPSEQSSWDRVVMKSAFWLACTPEMPWREAVGRFSDPVAYAAAKLRDLLREVVDAAAAEYVCPAVDNEDL